MSHYCPATCLSSMRESLQVDMIGLQRKQCSSENTIEIMAAKLLALSSYNQQEFLLLSTFWTLASISSKKMFVFQHPYVHTNPTKIWCTLSRWKSKIKKIEWFSLSFFNSKLRHCPSCASNSKRPANNSCSNWIQFELATLLTIWNVEAYWQCDRWIPRRW